MAVVFLEEPRRQYQCNWRAPISSWTRRSGMSIRALSNAGLTNHQAQFVAQSRLFSIVRNPAIEIWLKTTTKITMTTVKANKLEEPDDSERPSGRSRDPERRRTRSARRSARLLEEDYAASGPFPEEARHEKVSLLWHKTDIPAHTRLTW